MSEAAPALTACRCSQINLRFRQARHRDLPKPWVEAVEPSLDADGCDRKIASRGVVNTFDMRIPGGDARRRERPFTPHPPGDERGQMKADRLI